MKRRALLFFAAVAIAAAVLVLIQSESDGPVRVITTHNPRSVESSQEQIPLRIESSEFSPASEGQTLPPERVTRLSGVVRDNTTRAGIAAVVVELVDYNRKRAGAEYIVFGETLTSDSGSFEFDLRPEGGNFVVRASFDQVGRRAIVAQEVHVRPAEQKDVELLLFGGGQLDVRVTVAEDARARWTPIELEGLEVAYSFTSDVPILEVIGRTDYNGTVRFLGVDPQSRNDGGYLTLQGIGERFPEAVVSAKLWVDGRSVNHGTLVRPGQLAEFRVSLHEASRQYQVVLQSSLPERTPVHGMIVLDHLPVQEFRGIVGSQGEIWTGVALEEGRDAHRVALVWHDKELSRAALRVTGKMFTGTLTAEKGVRLSGTLLDSQGKPAQGINLNIGLRASPDEGRFITRVRTGSQGEFTFPLLPEGNYVIRAAHPKDGPLEMEGHDPTQWATPFRIQGDSQITLRLR
jgi:hypothetical protein